MFQQNSIQQNYQGPQIFYSKYNNQRDLPFQGSQQPQWILDHNTMTYIYVAPLVQREKNPNVNEGHPFSQQQSRQIQHYNDPQPNPPRYQHQSVQVAQMIDDPQPLRQDRQIQTTIHDIHEPEEKTNRFSRFIPPSKADFDFEQHFHAQNKNPHDEAQTKKVRVSQKDCYFPSLNNPNKNSNFIIEIEQSEVREVEFAHQPLIQFDNILSQNQKDPNIQTEPNVVQNGSRALQSRQALSRQSYHGLSQQPQQSYKGLEHSSQDADREKPKIFSHWIQYGGEGASSDKKEYEHFQPEYQERPEVEVWEEEVVLHSTSKPIPFGNIKPHSSERTSQAFQTLKPPSQIQIQGSKPSSRVKQKIFADSQRRDLKSEGSVEQGLKNDGFIYVQCGICRRLVNSEKSKYHSLYCFARLQNR